MATTYAKLRDNLKKYCDEAVARRKPVRVKRRDGSEIVLLAAEDYDSLAETAHLLASPANAARLLAALGRARRGKTKPLNVEDLRAAVGL